MDNHNYDAETATNLALVDGQIAFLRTAGPADAGRVLEIADQTLDGYEDPRLRAALDALQRIHGVSAPRRKEPLHAS